MSTPADRECILPDVLKRQTLRPVPRQQHRLKDHDLRRLGLLVVATVAAVVAVERHAKAEEPAFTSQRCLRSLWEADGLAVPKACPKPGPEGFEEVRGIIASRGDGKFEGLLVVDRAGEAFFSSQLFTCVGEGGCQRWGYDSTDRGTLTRLADIFATSPESRRAVQFIADCTSGKSRRCRGWKQFKSSSGTRRRLEGREGDCLKRLAAGEEAVPPPSVRNGNPYFRDTDLHDLFIVAPSDGGSRAFILPVSYGEEEPQTLFYFVDATGVRSGGVEDFVAWRDAEVVQVTFRDGNYRPVARAPERIATAAEAAIREASTPPGVSLDPTADALGDPEIHYAAARAAFERDDAEGGQAELERAWRAAGLSPSDKKAEAIARLQAASSMWTRDWKASAHLILAAWNGTGMAEPPTDRGVVTVPTAFARYLSLEARRTADSPTTPPTPSDRAQDAVAHPAASATSGSDEATRPALAEEIRAALQARDPERARRLLEADPAVAETLRTDPDIEAIIVANIREPAQELLAGRSTDHRSPELTSRLCHARTLYQRLLGGASWKKQIRQVAESVGSTDPLLASKAIRTLDSGRCK